MEQPSKALKQEITELISENGLLKQQLQQAMETIDAIKGGNVDALVIGNKKVKKIFTENTPDKKYRSLIEEMNEGAVMLNQDGTILYCNTCFASMLDLPLQKTIGEKINKFINHRSTEEVEILLKQSKGNPVKQEVFLNGKDGRVIPVQISVTSMLLDNIAILSMIITDLSIQHTYKKDLLERASQLEQLNSDLESANRDLTYFTHVSSHDLQEPLLKINNFVSSILLEDESTLSETGKYYFSRMQLSVKRMQALIDDLLAYSYVKSSERKLEDTDLNIIIEDVRKGYEDSMPQHGLAIDARDLCHVNIIPFQFRQLFRHLVSNSVKFSKPHTATHITIQTEIVTGDKAWNPKPSPESSYCHITYTDNGIGFDPRYKDYIFDVFKRLHTKDEYEGTGIGLAICKRIVENHHGIITATGELNESTRFDIYIPA